MENTVKNKVKQIVNKYKYNTILTLIIFILFLVSGYSNAVKKYNLFINNEQIEFEYGIYNQNNEQYIHIDDLINIFGQNVYHDKISGKIIITTYDKLIKINKNDEFYSIKVNGNIYFNLNKVINNMEKNMVVSEDDIYVFDTQYVEGKVHNNRVEIYDKIEGRVLCHLDKQDKVKIHVDDIVKDNSITILNVEATIGEKTYYGYALKKNFNYELPNIADESNLKKVLIVKADNNISTNTDLKYTDMIAINMFRLSSVNSLTKLEYTESLPDNAKLIATVNNGQKSSNYDSDIVTGMLNSDTNREKIIQQILNGVKNMSGVNLDFSDFKLSDKQNYTQFIKELAAVMHANNKIVIVNVANSQYVDVKETANVVDYLVIQPYFARTTSSKTSGPISSISYVEQSIKNILANQIDSNKVVLELPAYTILWTERRGTVINAEQYNMIAMTAYLKENSLQSKLDNTSGQNYINYTKGITTYKMWLEDEYSITKKIELVNQYNLAGISLYKSGMETKQIYSSISECLLK